MMCKIILLITVKIIIDGKQAYVLAHYTSPHQE